MNKHLLLGSALLAAISAYPQNGRLARPNGAIERIIRTEYNENTNHNSSAVVGPVKQIKHNINQSGKVMAATKFTGSMNVFGYLVSSSKPLTYNKAVNTVAFVHRKSATYTPASNGNSGSIVAMIGTGWPSIVWDSTCIWTNAANLGRYPQGGIYNPLGNTDKNQAYIVGMGPVTGGSGWLGNFYASKSLNGAGTNAPGTDQQSHLDAAPTIKKHYMSRTAFSSIEGGLVRSMAMIVNDPNGTTNAGFGLRGAAMVKGQFNAGAFVWSVDSFIPPVNTRSDGSGIISGAGPLQAWSEDGTIGYVIMIGSRSGNPVHMSGMQPIVYKTTNSGSSWTLLPSADYTTGWFKAFVDRTYPITTNSNVIVPNFQGSEGADATVDANGNLHFVSMAYGHYSSHLDSLGYRYVFGTEQYSYGNNGPFNYPMIYDWTLGNTSGAWAYHVVDSMGTEGPSGTSGQPGYGTNPWSDGSGAKMDLDARIQVSRSADGRKIFYSWTESDSTIVGLKWNIYPDIKMKGYDVTVNMMTPRINVSTGVTNADQQSYYHYMSDRAQGSSFNCMTVPFTITYNSTNDGSTNVDTYYLDHAQLCPSSFTVPVMAPVSVGNVTKSEVSFDVMNFPNPANDASTIVIGLKEASNLEVVIYNSVGQLMDTYKVNGQKGANEIHVDLSNFASGVYVYNVKVGNTSVTKKLIVE